MRLRRNPYRNRPCNRCGGPIKNAAYRHEHQVYCSEACVGAVRDKQYKDRLKQRICLYEECNKVFKPTYFTQSFCSEDCKKQRQYDQNKNPYKIKRSAGKRDSAKESGNVNLFTELDSYDFLNDAPYTTENMKEIWSIVNEELYGKKKKK